MAEIKTGKNFIRSFQTDKITNEVKNIRWQVIPQLPDKFVPFSKYVKVLKLEFAFGYLKSHSKKTINLMTQGLLPNYKTTTPDLDNLEKMLWDALKGVVMLDDGIIVEKNNVRKIYHPVPHISLALDGE